MSNHSKPRTELLHSLPTHALLTALLLVALLVFPTGAIATLGDDETLVEVDGLTFDGWSDFVRSQYFQAAGLRCGTPDHATRSLLYDLKAADPSDCSASSTNPTSDYDPNVLYEIPVVVHILMNSSCSQGVISDALVDSQIDILNEDLLALTGTNGGNGDDAQIRFVLASEDPSGAPTSGITRHCNTTWFNDSGSYWNSLAWDPHRYMNIYTNQAGGNLGYVPFLPADAGGSLVGTAADRVVVLWSSFGRDAPIGPPYDQGRTSTHEVGHYLGLEHTFNGSGCGSASPPGCYTDGDLICDTNVERNPGSSPCHVGASTSCGSVDPTDNYMDYSDDLCMERFTVEQIRRLRCTLESYRPDLYRVVGSSAPQVTISAPADNSSFPDGTSISFSGSADDAEDGDLTSSLSWSSDRDGNIGSGGSFSATLSQGAHTVTASVSDSGGLSGSATISVTVTDGCPWPLGHHHYCRDCGPCAAGEGDCDGDAQCNAGLVCVNDVGANYGYSSVTDVCEQPQSTCPWPLGHHHYCRDCGPCAEGEGDCDGDAQCGAGLVCVNDVGANYGYSSVTDVCEQPQSSCPWPLGHHHYCRDCGPCAEGEGDCDGDAQCGAGLTCVNDVGANYGYSSVTDVCEQPQSSCPWPLGHHHYCRDCGPCAAGEGDCDGNLQCEAGLTCVNDVGADYGYSSVTDVCEAP